MLKSILSICIMALCGLLVFALLLPVQANELAQKVLGEAVVINKAGSIGTTGSIATTISEKVSTVFSPSTTTHTSETNNPLSPENIIDATNKERVKAGLPPLRVNDKLQASAKAKVEDMIKNQYFDHTSPSGKTVGDLGRAAGYDYVVMGENLALGDFSDASDLLQAWMNSPGHKANILNASYEDMGAYAQQGMYQGRMVWFAVQHFGTEREVCPPVDAKLKGTIDALSTSLKQQEVIINTIRAQIEDPNHPSGQAYSALIDQFNTLVAKYNKDLTTSQSNIAVYNREVVSFNKCLSDYQVTSPSED